MRSRGQEFCHFRTTLASSEHHHRLKVELISLGVFPWNKDQLRMVIITLTGKRINFVNSNSSNVSYVS